MDNSIKNGLGFFLTLSLIVVYNHATKVEFYEKNYYQGSEHVTSSSSSCANLPSYFTNVNGSIRTDGCIMVFVEKYCKGNSDRIRPKTSTLGYTGDLRVRSFRDCNALESDSKINVDIYNQQGYKGDRIQFRDVCTCQNLPMSTRGKVLSMNNYGNCITVFVKSDCEGWDRKDVYGGQYEGTVQIAGTVQSFRYCYKIPGSCFRWNAVIYSMYPLEDFTLNPNSVKVLAMKGSGVFRNTGPNRMTERYSAELEVMETRQFQFSESFRSLTSVTLEAGFKMTTKGGVPGLAEAEMEIDMRASLSNEREKISGKTETRSTQKIQRFSVVKDIEVGSCTEQEVHSFVEVASDVEMNFRVRLKVTGSIQNRTRMNASDILSNWHLEQFKYVRSHDKYTVIAETTAKFKATYGIKTNTNSTGRRIPGCAFYSSANRLFHIRATFMHFLLFCTLQLLVTKL